MASNIHLRTVEALSEEFRRLLLRHGTDDLRSSLEEATNAMAILYGLPEKKIEQYGTLMREQPVLDTTKQMVAESAPSPLYLLAFVRAAQLEYQCRITRETLESALAGTHDVSALALPGLMEEGENNHTFLLQNTYRNYLRLPGIEPPSITTSCMSGICIASRIQRHPTISCMKSSRTGTVLGATRS